MLSLKFLGEIAITVNEKDITQQVSGKGAALLAILLMQKNKRISRERLIALLWPESREEAAKYNLRYNLWQLKKNLNSQGGDEPFLIISKDFCQINERSDYQCDFCQILDSDVTQIHKLETLEILNSLFTGEFFEAEYFSECEEFEEIIIMQRYALENKKLKLLKKLVAAYDELGDDDSCLRTLLACEILDPYDESNAEKRLKILVEKRDFVGALKYYQSYYNQLTRDLGIEPSERVKRLAGPLKSRRNKEMLIETETMSTIECFWVADVLRALNEYEGFHFSEFISKERIADLSYIQYRLGNFDVNPPMVRVIDSFIKLITKIAEAGIELTIKINKPNNMDNISKEVLVSILKRKFPNLYID